MNGRPLYHLHAVGKSYGDCTILRIDELDLCAASVFCLLGPTGAGKSTLLKLLAGLEEPTSGVVRFDGIDLNRRSLSPSVRHRIAMVHQRPYLLTGTVQFNVEYGLRIRRAPDRPQKVKAILQRLGVEALADRPVRTLSGGQVHLVALARALVVEPEVLLLDEPTADLDPARVALVEKVVRETQQKAAIVWATHNLFQARRVAARVGLLWNGQLVEVASNAQFFQSPSDARTRDFLEGRAIY